MSAEETPDTITIDLPIEVTKDGDIRVEGFVASSREMWRDIVINPDGWSPATQAIARAVVAWIERNEREPLPIIPEVGPRIKATLRDGREVEGEVIRVSEGTGFSRVHLGREWDYYYIDTSHEVDEASRDIIAWEYPDEPSPTLADIADQLEVVVKRLREVVQ